MASKGIMLSCKKCNHCLSIKAVSIIPKDFDELLLGENPVYIYKKYVITNNCPNCNLFIKNKKI